MKKNWSVLLSVLLITVFMLITACGSKSNDAKNSAANGGAQSESVAKKTDSLEMSKLTLGSGRDPQLASDLIVANEEGFFKEEGLTVDLQLFQAGSDLTAAIAGKSIPIGSAGDSPSTILKASGNPIQIIAQQSDISGAQAMVVNLKKIKVPSDLNGKKVAYSSGNTSEALFLKIIQKYGLDMKSMTIYKMGPTEMVAAYQHGDIDAFVVWEPSILNAVKYGGYRFISASQSYVPGQEGPQKLLGAHSLLIANTDFLKKNPETVKAVLRAMKKAVEFINAQPDKAAADVAKVLGVDQADIKTMMGLNKYSLEITPDLIRDIQNTAEFLKEKGTIKEIPNYNEFVNSSFLKEIDPTLVTK